MANLKGRRFWECEGRLRKKCFNKEEHVTNAQCCRLYQNMHLCNVYENEIYTDDIISSFATSPVLARGMPSHFIIEFCFNESHNKRTYNIISMYLPKPVQANENSLTISCNLRLLARSFKIRLAKCCFCSLVTLLDGNPSVLTKAVNHWHKLSKYFLLRANNTST